MRRVVVCAVLLSACGAPAAAVKQDALQAGLQSGMTACDVLRADPSIQREPAVDEFCRRMIEGCPK